MDSFPNTIAQALSDHYQIQREVGRGGMATVYLARDLKHERDVAIKVLLPELGATIGGDRFLSEIRTTARLQHPHILPLLDSGSVNGLLYYVMPFVTGETLRARLTREKQLPIADAIRIAREVGDALQYAHDAGVIHRDIKPENILLQGGHALVADFGIALAVQSAGGQRMTQTGLSLGTPSYMSPEQAMGERNIDARSDLYALGAVTYEMLTGDAPFTGATVQAIVAKVLTERPTPPRTVRDMVPDGVENAVLRALAKLPADRWTNVREFVDALETGRTSASFNDKAMSSAPTRPRWVWPAIAVTTAFVTGISTWALTRSQKTAESVVIPILAPVVDGELGSIFDVAMSKDGRMLAMTASGVDGIKAYVRQIDAVDVTPVPGTAGAVRVALSPKDDRVAIVAGDGTVEGTVSVVPLSPGTPKAIATVASFSSVAWMDDRHLIIGSYAGTSTHPLSHPSLAVCDLETGEIHALPTAFSSPADADAEPMVIPSTEFVAFIRWGPGFDEDDFLGFTSTKTGKAVVSHLKALRVLHYEDNRLFYIAPDGYIMGVTVNLSAGTIDESSARRVADARFSGSQYGNRNANGTLLLQRGTDTYQLVVGENKIRTVAPFESAPSLNTLKFSPDGRRLAISVTSRADGVASGDIWTYDLSTGEFTRVSGVGNVEAPVWSADGRDILFRAWFAGPQAIWRQPANGSAVAARIASVRAPELLVVADAHADGVLLCRGANVGASSLFFVPTADTVPVLLIRNHMPFACEASRSPDGRWLARTESVDSAQAVVVSSMKVTTNALRLSTVNAHSPRWSADGHTLYFVEQRPGQADGTIVAVQLALQGDQPSIVSRRNVLTLSDPRGVFDIAPDGVTVARLQLRSATRQWFAITNWTPSRAVSVPVAAHK